jgi:hypothetical protein
VRRVVFADRDLVAVVPSASGPDLRALGSASFPPPLGHQVPALSRTHKHSPGHTEQRSDAELAWNLAPSRNEASQVDQVNGQAIEAVATVDKRQIECPALPEER